jgi:hypothetical protein
VVTGYPTATTLLSVTPNPAQAFQSISLSASVASQFGNPSGTVSFFANGSLLTTVPLDAAQRAAATVDTLGAGTYAITAAYNASILYAASTSASIQLVVSGTPTATTLTASPNPSIFGQSVAFTATVAAPQSSVPPTGQVTFKDGAATLGTASLSPAGLATFALSTLAVGTHQVTATYTGAANDNPSVSTPLNQVVGLAPASVTLTADPNPANVGQPVSLVATVNPALAGSIVFKDQFGTLATLPLASGQAIFVSTTLAAGTHNLTAIFTGNASYATATSAILPELIQAHDFSITLSPATLTLVSGHKGQAAVSLTSIGSFAGPLTLTAASAPTYTSLSLNPNAVSLASAANATATLSVDTASLPPGVGLQSHPQLPGKLPTGLALAALVLLPFLRKRRRALTALLALALAALVVPTTGCTTIRYPLNDTAPGTYLILITATDPATQIAHTATLTLVVTK